jgi:hypothetical protein
MGVNPALKYLLGGAGALQAVLTGLGVSNGGIAILATNEPGTLAFGLIAVLVAVFIGALVLVLGKDNGLTKAFIGLAMVFLFGGIGVTGYAAVVVPAIAKAPDIDATLAESPTHQLVATIHVKASGIQEANPYWVKIEARRYEPGPKGGKYLPLGTPIYEAQLGADGQGNVDTKVEVPLPLGEYNVISVESWEGSGHGPCGSLEVPGGANLTHLPEEAIDKRGRIGCVVMRLPRDLKSPRPARGRARRH